MIVVIASVAKLILVIYMAKFLLRIYKTYVNSPTDRNDLLYVMMAIATAETAFLFSIFVYFFHIPIRNYMIYAYITALQLTLYFQALHWVFFYKYKLIYLKDVKSIIKLKHLRIIMAGFFTFSLIFSPVILHLIEKADFPTKIFNRIDFFPNVYITMYMYSFFVIYEIVSIIYLSLMAKEDGFYNIFKYAYVFMIISEIITILKAIISNGSAILEGTEILFFVMAIFLLIFGFYSIEH